MWPVDLRLRGARNTLFFVIGVQRVDCGVAQGQGRRARWIEEALQEMPVRADASLEHLLAALQMAAQRLRAQPALPRIDAVRVVVADAWLAITSVHWSRSFQRASSAVASARIQLGQAGFEVGATDAIRIGDAPFERPRLCAAFPAAMLSGLRDVARSFDARLTSVLPLSSAAWVVTEREARYENGSRQQALAVLDSGMMILALGQGWRGARLSDVTVRRVAGGEPTANGLGAAWARLGLRDAYLRRIDKVAVLDLSGSADFVLPKTADFTTASLPAGYPQADQAEGGVKVPARLTLALRANRLREALDAVHAPMRPSSSQWLMLSVAALLAGALALEAVQLHQSRRALSTQSRIDAPAARPVTLPVAWTREELVRVQAVNNAIRQLNLPIASLLHALEPPRDIQVAVVSVDANSASSDGQATNGRTSIVKVVAEASSSADMARYVAFVGERKPFIAAYLTGHEVNETAPEKPYRFTLDARWIEP